MHIQTLQQFGEDRFLAELEYFKRLCYPGDWRNTDWFDRLPEIYKTRFVEWFFLVEKQELIAFATIQQFYNGCYRLLTRTYYNPAHRRSHLYYDTNERTPAIHLAEAQLNFLNTYDTVFISMQDLKRRKALNRLASKLDSSWKLHPLMLRTCNEDSTNCFQSVIYRGQDIKLPGLSIDEWKTKKENECQ